MRKGFTLVEIIIGAALFGLLAVVVYQSFGNLMNVVGASRVKIAAADLANEEIEIIRNMPYQSVGIQNGIPAGLLPREKTVNRDGFEFLITTTVRNVDDSFDGTLGGEPNDLSPADYKFVQLDITCAQCKNFSSTAISAVVSAKSLETSSGNGALFIKVFDANGVPIQGANVHVENNLENPAIVIDELTNNNGELQIVDVPPGVNAYEISVTKNGYTSDFTLPPGAAGNPNPSKPHSTVVAGQVTQISFSIDRASAMDFESITNTCSTVSSLSFNLAGTKLIGTTPDILKYDEDHVTSSGGNLSVDNLEWDNYFAVPLDETYTIVGINPPLPLTLLPNSTQNVQLVADTLSPRTLVIAVKDVNSGLPLTDAQVTVSGAGTKTTDRGALSQTDWSGGAGQSVMIDESSFFASDGNVNVSNPEGEIVLWDAFGVYAESGELVSSTFDTGTSSNFFQVNFLPTDQPVEAGEDSVRLQIATNSDNATWNFIGPDGTSGSFYDAANTTLHSSHTGDRYLRYKVYLSTEDTDFTPNVSDVSIVFTSECIPPGQVHFSGLGSGMLTIDVEKSGYVDAQVLLEMNANWIYEEVFMTPE